MNISNPSLNRPPLLLEVTHTQAQSKADLSQLKPGEKLTARVSGYNNNTQQYTLKNDGFQLQVKSPHSLELGQKVQLEVSRATPNLQLRIVAADPNQQSIQQTLRTLVARQAPLDEMLAPLLKHNNTHSLPEPLTKLVRQLINTLPDTHSLRSAEGIKLALRDSGMFLEQKLAKSTLSGAVNSQSINSDVKVQLLRLIFMLKQYSSTDKPGNPATQLISEQSTRLAHPAMLLDTLFKKLNKNTGQDHTAKINRAITDPEQLSLLKELGQKSEATLARQ